MTDAKAEVRSLRVPNTLQIASQHKGNHIVRDRRSPRTKLTVNVDCSVGAGAERVIVSARVMKEDQTTPVQFDLPQSEFEVGRMGVVDMNQLRIPSAAYGSAYKATNVPEGQLRRHKRFQLVFQLLDSATGQPIGKPIKRKVKTAKARDSDEKRAYYSPDERGFGTVSDSEREADGCPEPSGQPPAAPDESPRSRSEDIEAERFAQSVLRDVPEDENGVSISENIQEHPGPPDNAVKLESIDLQTDDEHIQPAASQQSFLEHEKLCTADPSQGRIVILCRQPLSLSKKSYRIWSDTPLEMEVATLPIKNDGDNSSLLQKTAMPIATFVFA
mmetsp:Transcript_28368/g.77660  ORF Transcript_28368/g.77660 Transcript_28368/m.77660 type:complete len:330 (+) Transcript_28368:129-1118(+)|eukprot:scaffold325550_cov100-Tisochrysis_lutea.AAC.1